MNKVSWLKYLYMYREMEAEKATAGRDSEAWLGGGYRARHVQVSGNFCTKYSGKEETHLWPPCTYKMVRAWTSS